MKDLADPIAERSCAGMLGPGAGLLEGAAPLAFGTITFFSFKVRSLELSSDVGASLAALVVPWTFYAVIKYVTL